MFPWWEQALYLAAVASSPVRTESQAGLGDLASLHVTVRLQRPHVSGRRRTNTNSAFYLFRGDKTRLRGRCLKERLAPVSALLGMRRPVRHTSPVAHENGRRIPSKALT